MARVGPATWKTTNLSSLGFPPGEVRKRVKWETKPWIFVKVPGWEGSESWEDRTADKDVNFQVDGKCLQMPKEWDFRVVELISKAGSGSFKQYKPLWGLRGWEGSNYCNHVLWRRWRWSSYKSEHLTSEQGENTEKKIIKDRVRKLLDESNVIEINLSASFC